MLERGSDPGGTWRDNSYRGAEVDIPTGLYSISFIPYKFKKKYSPQSELLEYTNYVIDKFDLRKHAKTNQSVTKLTYNESKCLWHVEVESGETHTARFIIDTSGVLANPHIPDIEGAKSFRGAQFHTGQWDHNVPYEGKCVGAIGSGCSAAQVVPAITSQVDKLTVFMGKTQWLIPRSDRNYSSVERFITNFPIQSERSQHSHRPQLCYMETMVKYTVEAICTIKRDESIKAIDVRSNVQSEYVAKMKEKMKLTVWQSGECTAFYKKSMTGEVTSLSPESVVNFIFSRKWFHLKGYHLLR